jgi:hypothetical protein
MAKKHHTLNAIWPKPLPKLDGDEAIRAVKKLIRSEGFKPSGYHYCVTTGNRHTWTRRTSVGDKTWFVNSSRGWQSLVHHVSHWIFSRKNGNLSPHHWKHANIEARLIRLVLDRGWLSGSLKTTPKVERPPVPVNVVRVAMIRERIARWESKAKRAETALRKLKRSLAAIERYEAKKAAGLVPPPTPPAPRPKKPSKLEALRAEARALGELEITDGDAVLTAPRGRIWTSNGCHTLAVYDRGGEVAWFETLLAYARRGTDPCNDSPCDFCREESAGAATSSDEPSTRETA